MGFKSSFFEKKIFFAFIVSIKAIILSLISFQPYSKLSLLAFDASDTPSYVFPALNGLNTLKTSRMPGYSILIKISNKISNTYYLDLIIVSQILLSFISLYCIYKLSELLIIKKAAYIVVFIYALLPYISFYDLRILSESFSNSLIIISLYFFFVQNRKGRYSILLSSLFLAISIMIKPIGFIVLIWLIFYILFTKNTSIKKMSILLKVFSFFILFECFWMQMNYKRFEEIIPFTKTTLYSTYYDNLVTYAGFLNASYGGESKDDYLINPQVAEINLSLPFVSKFSFKMPYTIEDIYTSKYNKETLAELRLLIKDCETCFGEKTINWDKEVEIREEAFGTLEAMTRSIKKEHPLIAYFLAKISPISLFLSQDLSRKKYSQEALVYYYDTYSISDKLLRFIWNFTYSFIIIFGIIGCFMSLFSKVNLERTLGLLGLSLVFVYPVVYGFSEWRYIYTSLPFLVLFSIYFFKKIYGVYKDQVN